MIQHNNGESESACSIVALQSIGSYTQAILSYASGGSCLIGVSSFLTSSLPVEEMLMLLDRCVKGVRMSVSCSTVSVDDSLLPPCEPACFFALRAGLAELLPLRNLSSPGLLGSLPSGSGVGVELREDERECDSERNRPSRLRLSFRRSVEGFSFSASFSRSSCRLLLLLKTRKFRQPRHPVHHSQPPSRLATSRCRVLTTLRNSARLAFSRSQYSVLYVSQPSLKSGENGFGSSSSFSTSPDGAMSSSMSPCLVA